MITFLIGVAVLIYIWRRVTRPVHVIEPPAPPQSGGRPVR
jgi:hypothetical protein